ncbi:MAG: gamma-glutamylcyclotransferase [Gammaproteobacteria bacterium]|jgi:gamma-glutamylcyclotransferase (GGCT)/AIG2-like uncharacterized protein YtfP|nr:gamma-glutamylcyclotransferase [Gammaproteobacteria bacterium]
MNYFAYGSNLYWPRMRQRVPSARFVAVGKLTGYVLKFHKRGADESAKCNAYATGLSDDEVYGVVFNIDAQERPLLDAAEGLGNGYNHTHIKIVTDASVLTAFTYTTDPRFIDDSLILFIWYKKYVVEGAKRYALPASYVRMLEDIDAVPDDNHQRARRHADVLADTAADWDP